MESIQLQKINSRNVEDEVVRDMILSNTQEKQK